MHWKSPICLAAPDELGEDDGLEDGGEDADVADEDADHHGGEAEDEGEVDKEAGRLAGLNLFKKFIYWIESNHNLD